MKPTSPTIRLIFSTVVLGAFGSFTNAGPGPQFYETIRREAEFKKLSSFGAGPNSSLSTGRIA